MKTKLGNGRTSSMDAVQPHSSYIMEHYSALKRYCCYLTGSRWDGEDLAQEAIAKVYKKYVKEDCKENDISLSLLYKVARNQWVDQLRTKKGEVKLSAEPSYDPFTYLPELDSLVKAMLSHLTPSQTVMFVLKEVFQYSLSDIANLFSSSEGAVKSAIFRTRNRLKSLKEQKDDTKGEKTELYEVLVEAIHAQKPELIIRFIPTLLSAQSVKPIYPAQRKHAGSQPTMKLAA
ncbi:sigma-70 family RNA polymerase sigma factor [Bacillus songklensis]|uniref:Sigma-70 family RNA polymerase sigma factor n=1 Tax=Bacillus songklensis TaxID=1069116 RepID=A0ABV8B6W4_9BACI